MTAPPIGAITIWYRNAAAMSRLAANRQRIQAPPMDPLFVVNELAPDELRTLRETFPQATVLVPGRNLGTAAAWNWGIRVLADRGLRQVGIWNADVTFAPDAAARLVEVLESDPTIGAVQPLLLYADAPNVVEMYGASLDRRRGQTRHDFKGVSEVRALPATRDADYLDGGTMLARTDALARIGGFDERLFMYAEDVDLCLRLRAAGYRTIAVRDAHAWHHHRAERGTLPGPHQIFFETRNRFILARLHLDRRARLDLTARSLLATPRRVAYFLRRGRPALARAHLLALCAGASGQVGGPSWLKH